MTFFQSIVEISSKNMIFLYLWVESYRVLTFSDGCVFDVLLQIMRPKSTSRFFSVDKQRKLQFIFKAIYFLYYYSDSAVHFYS